MGNDKTGLMDKVRIYGMIHPLFMQDLLHGDHSNSDLLTLNVG